MAFTGVVALATAAGTAGAAITAGMVLVAVAEVGMALTVVGAVTGSEDLMKIGGVMSIIGGVGGAIAGAAGGAAGAAGLAETAAATAVDDVAAQVAAGSAMDAGLSSIATVPTEAAFNAAGAEFGNSLASYAAPSATPMAAQQAANSGVTPAASGAEGGDKFLATRTPSSPADIATPGVVDKTAINTPAGSTGFDGGVGDGFNWQFGSNSGQLATGGPIPADSWYAKLWNGLDASGKNTVIKTGSGLIQGLAKGSSEQDLNNLRKQDLALRAHGSAIPKGIVRSALA